MTVTVDKAASACPVWCNNHLDFAGEPLHFHSAKIQLADTQTGTNEAEWLEVSLSGNQAGELFIDLLTVDPTADLLASVPVDAARLLGQALIEAADLAALPMASTTQRVNR